MTSLEELRKENARLKAKHEVQEDFKRRNAERRKLIMENIGLKHPRSKKVIKTTGFIAKKAGKGIFRGVKTVGNFILG